MRQNITNDVVGVYIKDGFLYIYHTVEKPTAETINLLRQMKEVIILHNITIRNDGTKVIVAGEDMHKNQRMYRAVNYCITILGD